jgi:glycosyltransferase involved in cell wall biosynthesis
MRLLVLTPEFRRGGGGIATYYRHLAPALRERGVDVHVIEGSPQSTEDDRHLDTIDGVRVETLERARFETWRHRFSVFAAAPLLRNSLAAAWAMWDQAKRGEGFDLIEACDWGLSFVPPCLEGALPVILQLHGSIGQIGLHDAVEDDDIGGKMVRLIERAVAGTASHMQTSARANAAFWQSETGRDVEVLLPAWQPALIGGDRAAKDRATTDRALVIGRLQRWKGPHILAAAMRLLGTRAPAVDWYGRDMPWDKGELASTHMARRFPDVWGSAITHHQNVSAAKVADLQAGAKLNIVPSSWDVFNFTVVEAMASGRPVICSDGAGASSLIVDGENGYLFAKDDPAALARAIGRALDEDAGRLAEMAATALDTVLRRLDSQSVAAQRIAAYEKAATSFNSSPRKEATAWLHETCGPDGGDRQEYAFLDRVPLRTILSHAGSRLRRKVLDRLR